MTEKTVRRQSVSRRTLLSGTAGLLGGAALSSGPALAQNTAPASTAANSSYNPHYPDPAWLALRQDEIIEPGLEIVDPHHHLWDRPGNRFLLTELLADTSSGHNITRTVFVECGSMYRVDGPTGMKPVGETEFVNGTAAMSASGQYGQRGCAAASSVTPICGSATGSRKCSRPRSPPGTAAFAASAIPSPGMTAMRYQKGAPIRPRVRCSIRLGVLVSRVCRHSTSPSRPGFTTRNSPNSPISPGPSRRPRLSSTTSAARSGSGPTRRGKARPSLSGRPASLRSRSPSTWSSKLGGLGMPMGLFDFYTREKPPASTDLADAYRPYIETCIAAFGVDRSMFESNFPPDGASSSYPILWNAFKRLAAGYSPSEKAMLFGGTAKRVYRLA